MQKLQSHTTTSVPLSKDLLTHELALKILAGANQKGRWELLLVSEKLRKQQLCLSRLGLKVVVRRKPRKPRTTTSKLVPKDILTHEKVGKIRRTCRRQESTEISDDDNCNT